MGLVSAYGLSHGAHGAAYFADAQRREMELWFWESDRIGSGERIGPWGVTEEWAEGLLQRGAGACAMYQLRRAR